MNVRRTSLSIALLALMGTAPLAAQEIAGSAGARKAAERASTQAAAASREARDAAEQARRAAEVAARTGTRAEAHAAHEASVEAEDARNESIANAMSSGAGAATAETGARERPQAAVAARMEANDAINAAADARAAANAATSTAVQAITDNRPVVPVSPNASANARIATSAPGAMADHRHVTTSARFHLDTPALDTNRDGFLSQAEIAVNPTLVEAFARIDTNTDTRLSADELRTWIRSGGLSANARPLGDALAGMALGSSFQTLDLDGDGMLTTQEARVQTRLNARFRSLDKNRDGRLSMDEYSAWNTGKNR